MKSRIYGLFAWLAVLMMLVSAMQAQIRPWEQNVQVQISSPVFAMTSDGYGQHVITYSSGGLFEHYLIGNDGEVISANSGNIHPIRISEFGVSITNSTGIVSVVFDTTGDKLVLHQSTNGGASWTRKGSYNPSPHSIRNIDAFEERRNNRDMVHIVWDSDAGDTVYYVRYEGGTVNNFVASQTITNIGGITGKNPKIVTSSDRAHVSLVTTNDSQNKRGTMRDFVFSNGQWENSYRQTNTISSLVYAIGQENLGVRNNGTTDSIHITMDENSGPSSGYSIRLSRRKVDSDWPTTTEYYNWDHNNSDNPSSNRRRMVSVGDTLYAVFSRASSSDGGIKYGEYKQSSGWSSLYTVEPQSGGALRKVAISTSRTGIYVTWETPTPGDVHMARKAFPLSGSITENMFWTDSNWVSGDLAISSGYTVRAKAGSVTTVLANKKIIVAEGATLIVKGDAQFKFGAGASIDVQGTLMVQGTPGHAAIFARSGQSGTWSGIDIDASATNCSIEYAEFSDATTAITVPSDNGSVISHCTIDGGNIGIYLYYSSNPSEELRTQIQNNLIIGSSDAGIFVVRTPPKQP
jgi:parallel beta-helix repeat protein